MADTKSDPASNETFETAMSRLERIVEEMEDASLPLEELIVRYTEGTKLVKVCEDRLAAVEKKVETILRNQTGAPKLADFEPANELAGTGAATKTAPDRAADARLF